MDPSLLLSYAWVLLVLVFLEGLLAADNAIVMAVMVKHLPPEQRKKALFYGLLGAFVLAGTLLVGGVANAENWNGLANYPEVPNSANGTETYFFDKASEFKGIDSSRNNVFGVNVINMHNNQYGEATLFKYLVNPSLHTVYRYAPDGQVYQIQPGTNEFNMFMAAWKEVYGTTFEFPAL